MRCVILFRTHVWDDFVFRQFIKARDSSPFEIVILANNTNGLCPPIDGLPFVTFQVSDFRKLGLASGIEGDSTWYNADYPLYYYTSLFPDYDYYILWEYDVVVQADLPALMLEVAQEKKDVIAKTVDDPFHDCDYLYSIEGVYLKEDVEKTYFPFSIFSRRAVAELFSRRLFLSDRLNFGDIKVWPHAELFMGTELRASDLSLAQLSRYGKADFFSHYPPLFEGDIDQMKEQQFLHPVLDVERYLASVIRYEGRPGRFFNPMSNFHKTLRRFPASLYGQRLYAALIARARKLSGLLEQKLRGNRPNPRHS
ncbi:hypothetical protein [Acetobacter fallax]|uniref:Glycosyl transferase n=1 Tax=Acetobacter fallax TaxID=1737473 RepID=A0ABX0KBY9_9PROT|nr:hypothetical protein [Acetobacter fallax]NHO33676.1 hypothetical protein [Acetobacter fallax]NHO36501.1 hypothetical protein [Acetobacter fallax]